MPTYEFECPQGHVTTVYCRISERGNPVICGTCNQTALRVYSVPTVQTLEEHLDPELADVGSGEPFLVTSKPQKERRMRELGLDTVPMSPSARDRRHKGTVFSIPRGR